MGPFELQDLVGIETGFVISKSFFELGFGEPRWRPSPLSERMVASGRYGRKTKHGWYDYDGDGPYRPADPEPRRSAAGTQTASRFSATGRSPERCASAPSRPGGPATATAGCR